MIGARAPPSWLVAVVAAVAPWLFRRQAAIVPVVHECACECLCNQTVVCKAESAGVEPTFAFVISVFFVGLAIELVAGGCGRRRARSPVVVVEAGKGKGYRGQVFRML